MKRFLVPAYYVVHAEDADEATQRAADMAMARNAHAEAIGETHRLYLDERIDTEEAPNKLPTCVLDWPQMQHPKGCPNCGNEDGNDYDSGEFGENCVQEVTCRECDSVWIESYTPVGYTVWEPGDPSKKRKTK